jgi:hypothetical protein
MYVPCEDLSDLSDGQNWFHSSTISTHWELSIQHCLKLLDSKILAGVWIYSWNFWFHGSVSLRTSLQRISAKCHDTCCMHLCTDRELVGIR